MGFTEAAKNIGLNIVYLHRVVIILNTFQIPKAIWRIQTASGNVASFSKQGQGKTGNTFHRPFKGKMPSKGLLRQHTSACAPKVSKISKFGPFGAYFTAVRFHVDL